MRLFPALLVFGLTSCSYAKVDLEPGSYDRSIKVGGIERHYILRVPPAYTGKPLPIVMLLHGWTASAKLVELYTNFGAKADKEGFILLSPDGLGQLQGWNTGFLNLGQKGVDDVSFLSAALDAAEKEIKVDLRRVYVVGHSNGAMMAYVLGSKLSQKIAAIGIVAGMIGFDQGTNLARVDPPSSPVSAIILHGRKDPTVAYDHTTKALLGNGYSAPDSAAFWAKADGIVGSPVRTSKGDNVDIDDWKKGGIEVELISIRNGGHDWPGGLGNGGAETKTGVDAAGLIWTFLKAHPKA